MDTHATSLITEGTRLLAAGRSIIPVRGKIPVLKEEDGGWKPLQQKPLTVAQLTEFCHERKATGLAIIAGECSGGVEVIDFDYKRGQTFWPQFKAKAGSSLKGIPFQRTGSGNGFQGVYRCPKPGHNAKLASYDFGGDDPKARYDCLIETRGEGGYAVIPPSIHPVTHRAYQYVVGNFVDLPMISQDQRDTLIAIAQSLNQHEEPKPRQKVFKRRTEQGTAREAEAHVIKDLYNAQVPIHTALTNAGYHVVSDAWAVRPGGKKRTVKIDSVENKSYHNGASDPMCDGRGTQGYWRRPFDFLYVACHENYPEALRQAAAYVGVTLVTSKQPTSQAKPKAPSRPPLLVPSPRASFVIVTDHEPDLAVYQRLGVTALLSPRYMLTPEVVAAVEQYPARFVASPPPDDGYLFALAADLGAKLMALPGYLANIFDQTFTVLDLASAMQQATTPSLRSGFGF
jgi:hypothetical protein